MNIVSDVVTGLRFGDEGKGAVTARLLRQSIEKGTPYTECFRYNGGPNAGHTIFKNGRKIVTHVVPSGVVYGIPSFIGPGCVVNPQGFLEEIGYLQSVLPEYDIRSLVRIAEETHIITEEAVEEDCRTDKIGSTRKGIAPTYAAKALRVGKRAGEVPEIQEFVSSFPYPHVIGPVQYLFEGAQGFELDPDLGQYPYVTSSSGLPGAINTIVPVKTIRHIHGVAKCYDTYVGNNPDFGKKQEPVFEDIRREGYEYGSTTGRPRKIDWLDIVALHRAVRYTGTDVVHITKLDILENLDVFKLNINREIVTFPTSEEFCEEIKASLSSIPWHLEILFHRSPE